MRHQVRGKPVGAPIVLLAALFAALASTTAASGQTSFREPMLGVGYVANAPDMLAGGTVWGLVPGFHGWGVYVDAKYDVQDPTGNEGYEPDIAIDEVDPTDAEVDSEEWWWSVNAAVLRAVTPELNLYAGAGYASEKTYRQFWDTTGNLGHIGYYWVEDTEVSGGGVNVLAGAMLRVSSRVRIQFGGESRPAGFTVGASIVFPAR